MPEEPVALERTSLRDVGASLYWFSVRPCHVRSLPSLFADYDVELDGFPIANSSLKFVVVVLSNGSFMNEHILTCVIPVYETITPLDVIPLRGS